LWCRSGNESDSMAMADHRWPAVKKVQRFRWRRVVWCWYNPASHGGGRTGTGAPKQLQLPIGAANRIYRLLARGARI